MSRSAVPERLVVDTNVVFSALVADGATGGLLLSGAFSLFVPEFFEQELENHREEIRRKTGLGDEEFPTLLDLLFEDVTTVPKTRFEADLPTARELIGDVDRDDAPFLALALHLDADVWSDDSDFQEQAEVRSGRTHELIERFEQEQ